MKNPALIKESHRGPCFSPYVNGYSFKSAPVRRADDLTATDVEPLNIALKVWIKGTLGVG